MADYVLINSLGGGGAERQAVLIAQKLGAKIIILETDKAFRLPDILVIHISSHRHSTFRFLKFLALPWYAWRLSRIITKQDRVYSFLERANFVNIIAKFYVGHTCVITLMTFIPRAFEKGFHRVNIYLAKWLYHKADKIIANSYESAEATRVLCKLDSNKLVVDYNVLNISNIQRLGAESLPDWFKDFIKDKFVVINSGRLTAHKQQEYLLEMIAEFKKYESEICLIILGEGERGNELISLAKDLGLNVCNIKERLPRYTDEVVFLGYQENPFPYMKQADVFVLTSHCEGFPNVLIEALALSLPVVSFDVPSGPREILAPKIGGGAFVEDYYLGAFGILVKEGSVSGLVGSVQLLLNKREVLARYRMNSVIRAKQLNHEPDIRAWGINK